MTRATNSSSLVVLRKPMILKGQNSVYNNATQPENEPQENVKDLAARLEALQQDVQDIKEQLGLPPG